MAACFFLLKQFDDVLLYLNSIKSYYYNDDVFNFDYGQAKAAVGNYQEAEEIFLNITNEKLKIDYAYLSWLARCFIMNSKVGVLIINIDRKLCLGQQVYKLGHCMSSKKTIH